MTNGINKDYKSDIKNIKKFLLTRPKTKGCYCYGIGEELGKKVYKIILVTDDIWKWQVNNSHKKEVTQYIEFLRQSKYNFVEYLNIKDNDCIFDYVLMSEEEFRENSLNWKFMTYAEIFHKPFLTIKSNNELDNLIIENQKKALTTSILMSDYDKLNFYDLMIKLYCITGYLSSEKVSLVFENYDFLKYMYNKYDFISIGEDGTVKIDYEKLNKEVEKLPNKVKKHIYEYNGRKNISRIDDYFENRLYEEKSIIKTMRILINGLFSNFGYNNRQIKTKLLQRDKVANKKHA